MKRIIAFAAAASMMLFAVNSHAQIGLGVGAGFINSGRMLSESSLTKAHGFNGFYAGVDYTLKFTKELSLMPGIAFSYTTGKASVTKTNGDWITSKVDETYISVPIDLKYTAALAKTVNIFVLAGPVISYGLMSSEETNVSISTYELELGETINCYDKGINGSYPYSPFEVLIEAGGGVEVSRLRLTASYGFGLLDRYKGDDSSVSIKRNQFKVGLAFVF